jgi:hypothetical protein
MTNKEVFDKADPNIKVEVSLEIDGKRYGLTYPIGHFFGYRVEDGVRRCLEQLQNKVSDE